LVEGSSFNFGISRGSSKILDLSRHIDNGPEEHGGEYSNVKDILTDDIIGASIVRQAGGRGGFFALPRDPRLGAWRSIDGLHCNKA
jgi:hypothetical protein